LRSWLFPEAIRQSALGGAEVLVRVSASMDPRGTAQPLDWWTTVRRADLSGRQIANRVTRRDTAELSIVREITV
jgi:predicted amidohydrolase